MSKLTVFEQIIKLISRAEFEAAVNKHQGDKYTRNLDCWSWFGALLFGQMTGHDSIRAIERTFCHGHHRFSKLGFKTICRSTLADANTARPLGILEDTLDRIIARAGELCPNSHGFNFKDKIFALDASIIPLSLNLCPWAHWRRENGGVKLNTAIDIASDLPEFHVITHSKPHDLRAINYHTSFPKHATILFDRGYWCSDWLNELNRKNIYFVTRQRKNNTFKVVQSRPTNRTQGYLCDQIVYQTNKAWRNYPKYKGKLRRIKYNDPDTGNKLVFLTNRFDLPTEVICDLYKARWKVELFFKTLKQNLKIRKFLGVSLHAVKTQILVALIAYVLVQMLRFILKSTISIPDCMAVLGTLLLLREPLHKLLGQLPRVRPHPPPLQLELIF